MPEWQGKLIDNRYAVESVIGEGGMGVVLRARHTFTGATVAVKVLHPYLRLQDTLAARFLAEARAPATIGHPAIVSVSDAGRTPEGDLYLVMELLQGETLKGPMSRGALPFETIRKVLLDILDALAAAHAAGLIHRDLKPDNVFIVQPGGAIKLLDFGIAKVVREGNAQAQSATATGSVMGTLTYMSPEQLRDTKNVDHRTDLWALGVMLYELSAGVRPYEADTFGEMVAALLSGPPRPIGELVAQAPSGLDALLQRALAHDPQQRFASAAEMAAALRALPATPLVRRRDKGSTVPMGPGLQGPIDSPRTGAPALPSVTVPGAPLAAHAPPVRPRPAPTTPMGGLMQQALPMDAPMQRPRPLSYAPATLIGPYAPQGGPPPPQGPRATSSGAGVAIGVGIALLAVLVLGTIGVVSLVALSNSTDSPSPGPAKVNTQLCAVGCARIQACGTAFDPRCEVACGESPSFQACLKEAQSSADCNALAYCGLGAACDGRGPSGKGTCQAAASCEAECNSRIWNDKTCLCRCVEGMAMEHANPLLVQNECGLLRCPEGCGPSGDWSRCYACVAHECAAEIQACHER